MTEQQELMMTDHGDRKAPSAASHKGLEGKTYLINNNNMKIKKIEEIEDIESEETEMSLFIPAYAALVIKAISDLHLKEGTAQTECTLILRIDTSQLPPEISEVIEKRIGFRLCEKPFTLKNGETDGLNVHRNPKTGLLVFTYRFSPTISFITTLESTPFDQFDIEIPFELTSSSFQGDVVDKKFKNVSKYRFNLHIHKEIKNNFSFKESYDKLPEYDIRIKDSKVSLKSEGKDGEMIYWPKVIFKLRVVRNPWHLITIVLLPLFVLQLVNLALFMQSDDVNSKLANIATLLLAIFAYMPSIREEIPSNSYFTLIDIVIYSSIIVDGLALLETTLYNFFNEDLITYYLFGIAAILVALNGLTIWYCIFTHELYRKFGIQSNIGFSKIFKTKGSINQSKTLKNQEQKKDSRKFLTNEWKNSGLADKK